MATCIGSAWSLGPNFRLVLQQFALIERAVHRLIFPPAAVTVIKVKAVDGSRVRCFAYLGLPRPAVTASTGGVGMGFDGSSGRHGGGEDYEGGGNDIHTVPRLSHTSRFFWNLFARFASLSERSSSAED